MSNTPDAHESLEDRMRAAGGAVQMLRGPGQLGPYVFPGIPAEYTNWRDEVRAWKEGVALLEQSYHMSELHLRGAEVLRLLEEVAVNRLDPFRPMRAKQLVLASPDGYLIGDAIIFREEVEFFRLVGAPFALDWLQYCAQRSPHDVTATLEHNWSVVEAPRDVFRFQVQGPQALAVMDEVIKGGAPDVGFFSMADVTVANAPIRVLRHGMAGTPGFEVYGPWGDRPRVEESILAAGEKYGIRRAGENAYSTTAQESGWLPLPLPAIYHQEELLDYRRHLSAFTLEASGSLGGSMVSEDITDFYVDPIEAGYGRLVDWDRDFVGRAALAERADDPRRTKVTLVWNDDDVAAVLRDSLFGTGTRSQFIKMPSPMNATWAANEIVRTGASSSDARVGFSQYMSYSANAKHILSHGIIDVSLAEPGTELILRWGEPGSRRDNVEQNELRDIRVTVAPSPYFDKVIKTAGQ